MASVSFKKLEKTYGSLQVVKGIDLEVEDGEFAVLVGPSGCGKSTTLRMLAGLESISGGEIRIGDTIVNRLAPRHRDIAMVFQDYALYPHKSVYDNMAFSLKVRGVDAAESRRRVQDAADMLGIADYLDRKPAQLSGGQRQRVAMGRAIVRRPKVFLFDEPLSNLDAKLRGQVRTEIKKLHRTIGTTTIYVTHDQVEAMTLADRIVILKGGEIEQVGSPDEVYHQPRSVFVGGFIGSPAMNFLTARRDGDHLVLAGDQRLPLSSLPAERRVADGAEIVIGIRPEDFGVARDEAQTISGRVEVVEPLGSDTLIHLAIGDTIVTARLPPETRPAVGETIGLVFAPNRIQLFDSKSGRAIV